jgi:hypothetical protein
LYILGGRRGYCSVLIGKLDGKKPFGRHRRRWKANMKMNIQEVGWRGQGLN